MSNNKREYKYIKDDYRATSIAEGFAEDIDTVTVEEEIEAWQYLHDTGLAYSLQGWFGSTALRLIEAGVIER